MIYYDNIYHAPNRDGAVEKGSREMEQAQEQTFEAWVDEKRRLVSLHGSVGARRYWTPERAFRERVTELVLSGYRVQ